MERNKPLDAAAGFTKTAKAQTFGTVPARKAAGSKARMQSKDYMDLLFSDAYMFYRVMTSNPDICKKVVELCIGKKVRGIRYKEGEKTIDLAPETRGIRLDVYLEDDDQTIYDLEMQTVAKPFLGKRIRYYDGVMGLNSLHAGEEYDRLPNSYIVFLCLFDPFGEGRVRYEFQRREKVNPDLTLGDGSIDIIINAGGDTSKCSDEMKEFLAVLTGHVIGNGIGKAIDDAVREAKTHISWREQYMLLEQMLLEERNEGIEQGIEIGKEQGIEIGKEQGIEIGKEQGIASGKLVMLYSLTEKGRLTLSEAAEEAGQSESVFQEGLEIWRAEQADV